MESIKIERHWVLEHWSSGHGAKNSWHLIKKSLPKSRSASFNNSLENYFMGDFMNRKELLESVLKSAQLSSWSNRQSERFLNATLQIIIGAVKKSNDVTLTGFGTFTKVKRAARNGRNPSTGAKLKIKAKTVPKFRPGKEFKDAVK
jgi:DNA-binding protein HU-beta